MLNLLPLAQVPRKAGANLQLIYELSKFFTSFFETTDKFHCQLNLKVIKTNYSIDKAANVISGSRGPLESHTTKHLCGVVVVGLYPAHGVLTAHDIGHQRTQ